MALTGAQIDKGAADGCRFQRFGIDAMRHDLRQRWRDHRLTARRARFFDAIFEYQINAHVLRAVDTRLQDFALTGRQISRFLIERRKRDVLRLAILLLRDSDDRD